VIGTQRQRNIAGLVIFTFLLIAWSSFLYFAGPGFLIEAVGVQNGYILGFLVAAIGGVSTVTSISFYSLVTALAAGGLNPFLLGPIMGTGVTIGDTIFFYLGRTGRHSLPDRLQHHVDQTLEWAYEQPKGTVHLLVFSWAAFMPLPNDLITVPSGISRFEPEVILPFVLLGNITFTTLLALVVRYGFAA
jgi:membrane protein DedA with SNARE-associated domain